MICRAGVSYPADQHAPRPRVARTKQESTCAAAVVWRIREVL